MIIKNIKGSKMSFNECGRLLDIFSINYDAKINFFEYVYGKIARDTKNRFVDRNNDSIDIVTPFDGSIKVIPMYKNIDKNNLFIGDEIRKAIEIIQTTDFSNVYFVYPKNDNFNKHIQVKVPILENACCEYMIKIIPYSLTTLQNKCKKELL
jgi:hypothetical protein